MQLFDIYEKKLGRGEDGIFGYNLSKIKPLYAAKEVYFNHNGDNESTYSLNNYDHAERFIFSRLFLSCEYYRLRNDSTYKGYFRFHHYALGKILGMSIRFILSRDKTKKELLIGYIRGYIKALLFNFDFKLSRNEFWSKEASIDL